MKRSIAALQEEKFDLVVLGGGITGAGVALDAALRGLRVALIDKGDFGSGTSSVSSKLVHGGLRYLERAQFGLVHEALVERTRLLRNAPHLVWPLRFVLPFYEGARIKPWQWRAALTAYDLLAGDGNIQRSGLVSPERLRRECPWLRASGLTGAATYFDAQMEDARLCLAVVRTATGQGACVANYVEALGFEMRAGAIVGVRARDGISGAEFVIGARLVLNATGPWVDAVCRLAGDASGPRLETTKGVHLIVAHQGIDAGLLLLHPLDGRVFFVLPWLGKTLIGTTDTFESNAADRLEVTDGDAEYLLRGFNAYRNQPLGASDVLGRFAGVRPLLRGNEGKASARSREFGIFHSPSGLISVAGGKYTTYRSMAEDVTDEVMRRVGRRARCRTATYRLDGVPDEPWLSFRAREIPAISAEFDIGIAAADHLVRRYGTRAREACTFIQNKDDVRPITEGQPDLHFETRYQQKCEMAIKPEDFSLRRTRTGMWTSEPRT